MEKILILVLLYQTTLVVKADSFDEIGITSECPLQPSKFFCNANSRFSEIDGSCNNLQKPWLGKANIPYKRYLTPVYDDLVNTPRTLSKSRLPLPNPRILSRFLSMENSNFEVNYSHMLALFGQFLAHDTTNSPAGTNIDKNGNFINCDCSFPQNSECISIQMPSNENIIRMSCMRFTRTAAASSTMNCLFKRREQTNALTSFLDASQIYGSSLERSQKIRLFQRGLLRSSQGTLPWRQFLPTAPNEFCGEGNQMTSCFLAGEDRANENVGLAGLQTLFMREHNRIATELSSINPTWNDERLFQESRKIVIGMYQHIIYKEWLPTIIGQEFAGATQVLPLPDVRYNNVYDPLANPSISNDFAAGAFRFGHTLMRSKFSRFDSNNFVFSTSVNISKLIFKTVEAFNSNLGGLESIFLGLINEPASKFDTSFADTLQNHLFEVILPDGTVQATDLFAANINRGRDHGLPSYNQYRKLCGLTLAINFQDLANEISWENIQRLASIYENVDDIDLYVGGLSENPINGGVVGKTFACIIGNQFRDLKRGDRFYYENGINPVTAFSLDQLREIKKNSLSRLICNDFDINFIQQNAFLMPSSPNNFRVFCNDLPKMDLAKWKEF